MTKLTKAFFACIVVVACKQASEVKVAQNRDPILSTVTKLFTKLIGRPPHATEIQEYRDAIEKPEYQGKAYPAILTTLLASEAYWREGFYHLHRNRLLIDDSSELFQFIAKNDLQSLKLELADVAKSKHYWDILTYRERWLPVPYDYCVEQFFNNSEEAEPTCIIEKILPNQNIYNLYANECCTKLPDLLDPPYCSELDSKYQGLFAKNFCDVKEEDKNEEDKNEEDKNVGWKDEQLKNAIFLYFSMDFNRDLVNQALGRRNASRFFMFEVPEGSQKKDLFLKYPDSDNTFLKVRMTDIDGVTAKQIEATAEDVQGIHANPYWLSRHRTTSKNRHLHRARIISLSWFCEDISPDAATKSDKQPTWKQLLKFRSYFAEDDKHATSDQACFNCHKRIQPIANYFGKMSMGTNYSIIEEAPDELKRRFFAQEEDAFERPGVYYDPQRGMFFDHDNKRFDDFASKFSYHDSLIYYPGSGDDVEDKYYDKRNKNYLKPDKVIVNPIESYGLGGLAATISSLPLVKKCVVESTWNTIFGSEWRLGSNEVDEAISAFEQYGYDYSKLLEHLLTKKKAEIFFSAADGEKRFQEMVAVEKEKLACDAMQELPGQEDLSIAATRIFKANCVKCHHYSDVKGDVKGDVKEYPEFSDRHLFKESGELDEDKFEEDVNIGTILDKIFDNMPLGGIYAENVNLNADQQQKIMTCFLEQKRGGDTELPQKQKKEDLNNIHEVKNKL